MLQNVVDRDIYCEIKLFILFSKHRLYSYLNTSGIDIYIEFRNDHLYSLIGVLLDILQRTGLKGYEAFLESLELDYPDVYRKITGKEPARVFSVLIGKLYIFFQMYYVM